MSTVLSTTGSGPHAKKLIITHEGEHHGDYSDISLKVTRATVIFTLCAALNSCNLGYDIGVSTNAGSLIQRDLGLTDIQRELFVGSLNFWSIFGSLFSHWICDVYGRRKSFQVAALAFIIGLIIMACANGFAVLMLGRFFVGLGVGFGLAIDPLYIAEVSPAAHRGELVTWSEMAINVGIVLGFFSGIVFYNVNDNLEWRLMFAMGCILPVVMIILSRTVMVESPRWLVSKGQEEQAKEILRKVYPEGFDVNPVAQDIKEALERERIAEQQIGWNVILFPTRAIKRMLIVGVGTAVAQQAVGIDAIQYYLIDVLDESGITSEKAQLGVLMLLGILKLFFIVVGSKLLDRRGRRPLLFVSLVGMCGACILTSFSFFGKNKNKSTFAIVGLSLYLSFFSVGMGPGAWLIPSEVFATSIRAKAMSIATFFNRITATLMASTFLSTANAIGWGPFFIMLASISVVVLVFVCCMLPETKGRSLEDMSLYFAELTGDDSILEAERKVINDRERAGGVEMTPTPQEALSSTGEAA
ncbi:D-xylose-proton symporter [Nitzschia inconspicua]|uniref:Hexose transporter 1 n=1 Tax=Nitzschia inconspicua TaxID=303405 RepID=A0A9K3LEI6_9STRA|nr:D-xylose-proton symporter [Nitzschia inconspicua]